MVNKQRGLGLGSLEVACSGTLGTESGEGGIEGLELSRVRTAFPYLVRHPGTPCSHGHRESHSAKRCSPGTTASAFGVVFLAPEEAPPRPFLSLFPYRAIDLITVRIPNFTGRGFPVVLPPPQ